ncbi:MAG: phage tail family protein [Bacillus sp. (in: firmicutes)]
MDKSIFNFKIIKQDGTIIDMHEKNLFVNFFRISSPSPEHSVEQVDGRHGNIYLGTTLQERKIATQLTVEASDYKDFDMFRDELFRIFNPLEEFYIVRDIQPKKKLKVSVANQFDLEYVWLELGELPVEFVIHSTFLESVSTTLPPLTFESEAWQTGQGLNLEEPVYVHQSKTFRIFNAGDVPVDPRSMDLLIKFVGNATNLQIKNLTTGDTWQHTGSLVKSDTLLLNGIKSLKNGQSIFKNTNKKLITIAPGWNDFEITGASDFLITFDFRFYYY